MLRKQNCPEKQNRKYSLPLGKEENLLPQQMPRDRAETEKDDPETKVPLQGFVVFAGLLLVTLQSTV